MLTVASHGSSDVEQPTVYDFISVLVEISGSMPGVLRAGDRKGRKLSSLCLIAVPGHICPGEKRPGPQTGSCMADSALRAMRRLQHSATVA